MSGAEDKEVLADILETAGQRAEEIRVEIASLKEKTGNNAVTVPQLLKGDAIPDVTEPAEATRQDEHDTSLQFTASTPSGERQAPPKTEDGTDTEELEHEHAALHSPIQVYVQPSSNAATGGQRDAAGQPSNTADAACTGSSDGSCQAAGAQPDPDSWQGLYQGMLGKLNKSQATEQQGARSVAAILKSAGMASAMHSSSCNARLQHMATPFAQDTGQAAAVAAGAMTLQHFEEEAAASASMLPSPVHVVEGPYKAGEGAAAAAYAAHAVAEHAEQWGPAWSVQSPSKPGRAGCSNADAEASCLAHDADGATPPPRLVVPASAADLPVQAVLDELDELLSWSSRTPTHHQQQQQQQQQGQGRLFSRSDNNVGGAEEGVHHKQQQQHQGEGTVVASAAAAAARSGGGAAVADEEDLVLRWLRSQKGHVSRRNSTSCLLSDECMQRSSSSSSSSSNSRMRRSSSLPPEPLSGARLAAGGVEVAAAAGAEDEQAELTLHKQLQQQHDPDMKEEILAHLRLAAAFRPRAGERPTSGSLPHPCTPPAAAPGAASATAAADGPAAAKCAAAGPPTAAMAAAAEAVVHAVDLAGWVGQHTGGQAAPARPPGSSPREFGPDEARPQLLCGGVLGKAAAGPHHGAAGGGEHGSCDKLVSSSFSVLVDAAAAAGVDAGAATGGNSPQGQAANAAAGAAAVPASPKATSKSAQLYQQLLMRSHGSSPKGSSGGGSSSSAARGREGGSRGGGSSSQSQPGSKTQQGAGCRSPLKARGSTSAGGVAQQAPAAMADSGWPSPDAAVLRSESPGRPRLELQLPQSQTEEEAAGCSPVKCTACGSPVLCGRPGTTLQHTRTSVADLSAEMAACAAAADGEAAAAGQAAIGAAVCSKGCNPAAPAADGNAATAAGTAEDSPSVRGNNPAASAAAANHTYSASYASISLAALIGDAAGGSSSSFSGARGCSSLRLHSPAAAGSLIKAGGYAGSGSAPATPQGSNRRHQQQPAKYATLGRQSGYAGAAALPGRRSGHVAAMRTSCAATGGPSGHAGTAAERVGRPRVGTASTPGAAAAAGPVKVAQAGEVPAVTTAISCGQLLAAAALERALGRVSAGGATAAAGPGSITSFTAEQDDKQVLEQELRLPGVRAAEVAQQQEACSPDMSSLTCLLELERDIEEEEAALEGELARLQVRSSTARATGQTHQTTASLAVHRLDSADKSVSGISSSSAAPARGVGGSTAAAAAAAAALQTLAACASRGVQRSASLSPSRMGSSLSPSRMSSLTRTSTRASNRSSSTDVPSRGSAGMSRSSSARSAGAPGFGGGSSRDVSSSAGSSRVWRPGGRCTSAKDDCRKLQDYESARSRLLGPVSEAGAAGGVSDVGDSKSSNNCSPKPSAFGRSSSPAKRPGRAGAAAAAAVAAAAAQEGGTATGAKARGTVIIGGSACRGGVAVMTSAAAAPTSKSAMAAARAAARSMPQRSPAAAASRTAAAASGRATAAGTTGSRVSSGVCSRTTAAAAANTPSMQEQGVQADIRTPRVDVGPLPQLPQLLDTGSLLHELSRRTQRPARHSTPGRLQAASRFPALVLPGQRQQHQPGSSSPTTSQVEEAIKAAQVALLQRRWQISQLRKTMAQHGIASTAGMRSGRSSSANHGSLVSGGMRHENCGPEVALAGSSLDENTRPMLCGVGHSTHSGSNCEKQDRFSYDSLGAAGSSSSQPVTPAAAVLAQLLQGCSRSDEHGAAAAAAEGPGGGASDAGPHLEQAATGAGLTRHHSSTSSDAGQTCSGATVAAPGMCDNEQHNSVASRSFSPSRAAAAAMPAAAKYRSASAFDTASRLCADEPGMPLRPSSAQAVVMKAAAAAAATAAVIDQKLHTSNIFASPQEQRQDAAAAALQEQPTGVDSGMDLGSCRSSCCKDLNPLRRRSSLGSPAAAGSSAGNSAAGGAAATPPWSAPRRVSSSGLTGEELMAYYRRSSVAEAAEAAAQAAAASEVPAARLQLDVLLRAFNALAKRKNTADRSAALAALMDQIMAVATEAAPAAAAAAGAEPLAGMNARELTVDSDSSALVVDSSKLDVLGRSVDSSPRPAPPLCDSASGRGSPGIAGGSVLQVRKGDMRAGWQSARAERQAAHDSLLSTPRHKRPASAGYAADLAALTSGGSAQGVPWQAGQQQQQQQQQQQLAAPDERQEDEEEAGTEDGLSPTHAMLVHTAARLGEFGGCPAGSKLSRCTGIPMEALAAAAPHGNGIVVVRMSTTETCGRLPLLRDTPAGKAVLAGIDGTSLTVQQAVHWLRVGLTRLPSSDAGGGQRQVPPAGSRPAQQAPRVPSPQSPSRRARSRPCSPFRACFASSALSSEEEEEVDAVQQQQQQQLEGVHFEMDSSSQLVMVVPESLAADTQEGLDGQQQQQQQQQGLGGGAAGVHKYTVTGVALDADEGCRPGISGSGGYCLELITSAGRHRIELASERDFAGLLAGLNAMLLLKEAGGDAAEKLGALPLEETAWAGAVEGWQGDASLHPLAGHGGAVEEHS